MENYIVSFRKYRPASFDTVVGQHHITETLKNAIRTQQLAQAFLFCGPRGVGKTTCARIFAKTINCTQLTAEGEACNTCDSCVSFNRGGSMAIHELDAASNNSVDDIRSLVEQVRYAPQGSKYKIYIIDEVHMLSTAAFNAFLKTLEEPPSYAIFILATTEKHKILPTILSRCQIFDFNRIQIDDIAKQLERICAQEGITYEYSALHVIAQKADGALRDALSIMDQVVSFSGGVLSYAAVIENLNIIDHEYYFRVTDLLLSQDMPEVSLLFDEVVSKGFEGINFITGLASHFRNLLMAKDARTVKLLEVSDEAKAKYLQQTQKSHPGFLLSALNLASHAEVNYKQSKQPRLLVELALMKMCFLPQFRDGMQMGEELKKKVAEQPTVQAFVNPAPIATVKVAAAMPTPPSDSTSKVAGKSGLSTIKIGKNLAGIKTTVAQVSFAEDGAKLLEEEVQTELDFATAWQKLLTEVKQLKKDYVHAILSEHAPVLDNDQAITLNVLSDVQHQILEQEKGELLEKLRKWTGNSSIKIAYVFLKNDSDVIKPVTSVDKFSRMVEKNPHLLSMIEKFGLDIDY
ncbi:MAG: DNA polymerase III subunit gamma/tau [Sphingobacteriaceae bacterium]|nr:DNA polymerase III subunit gamma/tau [Sphingobacteriaceae bacterium]